MRIVVEVTASSSDVVDRDGPCQCDERRAARADEKQKRR